MPSDEPTAPPSESFYSRAGAECEFANFAEPHPYRLPIPIRRDGDRARQQEEWEAHELLARPAVDRAMEHWIAHRIVPPVPPEEAYFAWTRFVAAGRFLYQIEGSSVIPEPTVSYERFVRSMLFEWWYYHGSSEVFSYIQDEFTESDQ